MSILLLRIFHICALATYVFHIWLYLILTKRSGDIEQNPGPKSNSSQSFSICHWNLNSISAHNFIKISLLKSYTATHKVDVICLSETLSVHKKGDKQILKNYRPKIFERLLYDRMFEFFTTNNLISKNQSGFRPGDSCIYQLLSITHEIYQSFDDNLEV